MVTHNFAAKERKSDNAKTHCQPVKSLRPLGDELEEVPGICTKYLWVGYIVGDDPKKHKNQQCGRQKKNEGTTHMNLTDKAMPVVMQITDEMTASCTFYMLCEPVVGTEAVCRRRHAVKISFHDMALLIFEEFLNLPHIITSDINAKPAEQHAKQNLRYRSSISKRDPGVDIAASVSDHIEDDSSPKPRNAGDGRESALGLIDLGLETTGYGVQTFFTFDSGTEYDCEDAHALLHELKEAQPTMRLTSLMLVRRACAILQAMPDMRPRGHTGGLQYLLEECQANWPAPIPAGPIATAQERDVLAKAIERDKNNLTTLQLL
ncbi:hypothetical protein BST61_g6636 [Cercospora zeina]